MAAKKRPHKEVTRVAYFFVPVSREIEMPEKPIEVQTVLPHGDIDSLNPDVVPSLMADKNPSRVSPRHNEEVFFEDYVHDWNYVAGKLHYFSRIRQDRIWIRCEFGKGVYDD